MRKSHSLDLVASCGSRTKEVLCYSSSKKIVSNIGFSLSACHCGKRGGGDFRACDTLLRFIAEKVRHNEKKRREDHLRGNMQHKVL